MSYTQCNATSKRTGERCQARAVTGSSKCYHHGGATPRGLDLPQTKHGRYSKVIPLRMAARYEEGKADPELLHLRDEVVLLDARLSDLLARVDSGESGALWQALKDERRALIDAQRAKDTVAQAQALNAILRLINEGHSDYQAWRELGSVIDQRRRLVESERKRLVEMQQVITAQQANLMMASIVRLIQENITDRSVLARITEGLDHLLTIDQ